MLQADVEAQKNVLPFLKHRVLREVVRSFTSSPNDDFEIWAKNQQAIDMLKEAQRLLDNGYITEQEMEKSLLPHLQVTASTAPSSTGIGNVSPNSILACVTTDFTER